MVVGYVGCTYVVILLNWTPIFDWYIWQGLCLRMKTKKIDVTMRLDHMFII